MADATKPAIGQVWADNDPRCLGRELVIRKIFELNGRMFAMCQGVGGRMHRIRLDRLKPTRNGYRFVRASL